MSNEYKDWIIEETRDLTQFLEIQSPFYLEGFYAEDNAKNPYDFFDDYLKHYNFHIGNNSERRYFYQSHCTF